MRAWTAGSLSSTAWRADWPPLAWPASCRPGSSTVHVWHGEQVEARSSWFCEAVWDRPYDEGDFDETDLVFGSGARARDGRLTFVSSGSTVDRLQSLARTDATFVSNSLICLIAATGASVDPTYPSYPEDFETVIKGIDAYKRQLPTSAGSVELTYFHDLTWTGEDLVRTEKPSPVRDFSSFERYRAFLDSSLERIATNLSAPSRARPYEMIGTLSSGYDSPMVATLAREAGSQEVISFATARGGDADDGRHVARDLGLTLTLVSRDAWRERRLPEIAFIASDSKGEDVYVCGAEDHLRGRVLLTGFHGGGVWAIEEAGVARASFGVSKKAASVIFTERQSYLTPASLRDYRRWLRRNAWRPGHWKLPPAVVVEAWILTRPLLRLARLALRTIARASPEGAFRSWAYAALPRLAGRRVEAFRYVLPWPSNGHGRYGRSPVS